MAVIDELKQALISPFLNLSSKDVQGLLQPQQTKLQAGLLGALERIQPYMGYTTTPTTFGQAAVSALTGAAGGLQQKQESDLARALQGLQLYSALDTDDDSEFDKQLKEYEKLSLIPQDQRTKQQQLRLDVLTDKLRDQPTKDSLSDFTLSVIKKAQEEGIDSLSGVEEDAYNRWKKGGGDLFSFLQGASGDSGMTQEPIPKENNFSYAQNLSPQTILDMMNDLSDDMGEKLYESLDPEKKEKVSELYDQNRG
jgi:hypothetical protein